MIQSIAAAAAAIVLFSAAAAAQAASDAAPAAKAAETSAPGKGKPNKDKVAPSTILSSSSVLASCSNPGLQVNFPRNAAKLKPTRIAASNIHEYRSME